LNQEEIINPLLSTPMTINLILKQDRTGRGGDQIPFQQKGYTAIRITEQNENGNGKGLPPTVSIQQGIFSVLIRIFPPMA